MTTPTRIRTLAVAALAGLAALNAPAGTDSPFAANLSINYAPPGARSQAMGGAFIGLADDATAAYVNPAGLVQLSKPEVMVQFTDGTTGLDIHNFSGFYIEAAGNAPAGSQTYKDLKGDRSQGSMQGINFISYAHPFKYAVIALSVSREVDFHAVGFTQGQTYTNQYFVFTPPNGCSAGFNCVETNVYDKPQDYYGRLRVYQAGLSGAFRLGRRFSLGVTLSRAETHQNYLNNFYLQSNRSLPGNFQFSIRDTGSDSSWTGVAGLQWRPGEKFQMGATYKKGASYTSTADLKVVQSGFTTLHDDNFKHETKLPDMYGVGFVWRPMPVMVVNLDVTRVTYSNLAEGMRTFAQDEIDLSVPNTSFKIDDANEYHLGLEYVQVIGGAPAVFRLGGWREAKHGLRYVKDSHYFVQDPATPVPVPDPDAYNRFAQVVMQNRFPGGEAQTHYSAGVGLVLRGKVQLDMGYDYSPLNRSFIFSGIYRFGHQ